MTRLAVLSIPQASGWHTILRDLLSWREPLADLGVRMCPGKSSPSWANTARGTLDIRPRPAVRRLAEEAVADGVEVLLLATDRLEEPLQRLDRVASLETFAADLKMPLTVVSLIRDQVGYLNALYCQRVLRMETAHSFAAYVADTLDATRFDYERAFSQLTSSSSLSFSAVRINETPEGAEARDLLLTLGLPEAAVCALPREDGRHELPGPVVIAAARLLFKRLWRAGLMKGGHEREVLAAGRRLRENGDDRGWDDGPFWGWTDEGRADAVRRFQAGNDALWQEVHGHPWGDVWESGAHVDVDLPTLEPALVADVIATLDRVFAGVQTAHGGPTT